MPTVFSRIVLGSILELCPIDHRSIGQPQSFEEALPYFHYLLLSCEALLYLVHLLDCCELLVVELPAPDYLDFVPLNCEQCHHDEQQRLAEEGERP